MLDDHMPDTLKSKESGWDFEMDYMVWLSTFDDHMANELKSSRHAAQVWMSNRLYAICFGFPCLMTTCRTSCGTDAVNYCFRVYRVSHQSSSHAAQVWMSNGLDAICFGCPCLMTTCRTSCGTDEVKYCFRVYRVSH
jgi:hypothetical protein